AVAGWLLRTIVSRKTGFRRTGLDLPIWLFLLWTILSAIFSAEPRISLAKLQSVCVIFLFYLAQAVVTRRTAVGLIALMIVSGCDGPLWRAFDLLRVRGVVVESIAAGSPFQQVQTEEDGYFGPQFKPATMALGQGDTIWRVGNVRVWSAPDIDAAIKAAPPNTRLRLSVITHGEHVEWPGIMITRELQSRASPSGITGSGASHRFRASGWTRHYEYFAEILQLLAQLALGLGLANFQNHGANRRCKLAIIATAVLAFGIAF